MARTSAKNTPLARKTSTATKATPRSRASTAQKKQAASTATTEAEGGAQPSTEHQDNSDQGEIARLRAQLAKESDARKAAEARVLASQLPNRHHDDEIVMIPRPKGEAGNAKRGFHLRTAMCLDGDSGKNEFEAIQRSVRTYAIEARIDFGVDYRRQDVDKLANVFKLTRKAHPYLTVKRFPANWASAEILKQFLRNRRRYAVKKGRLESRAARKSREAQESNGTTGGEGIRRRTGLRNVDDDDDDEPHHSEDEH